MSYLLPECFFMLQHCHLQGVFVAVPEDLFHWHLLVSCSVSSYSDLHGEAYKPLIQGFKLYCTVSFQQEMHLNKNGELNLGTANTHNWSLGASIKNEKMRGTTVHGSLYFGFLKGVTVF
jgi:hypothetical protein